MATSTTGGLRNDADEKLDEELKILKEIEETRNQIRRTRSAIRREQLARHIHKLERKYWALEKQNET